MGSVAEANSGLSGAAAFLSNIPALELSIMIDRWVGPVLTAPLLTVA